MAGQHVWGVLRYIGQISTKEIHGYNVNKVCQFSKKRGYVQNKLIFLLKIIL